MPVLHTRAMTMTMSVAGVVLALLTGTAATRGRTIEVRAGDNLQHALDAAVPGDTLLLEPGARFVGNFVLPRFEGDGHVTVQSGVTGAWLPAHGQRVLPSDAPNLAKIQSPNDRPVLQTAPGAHHWRLVLLEFGPNATAGNDIIRLGDSSSRQSSLAAVPYELEIDRCFIHGDPVHGQKRGVALNSAATRIVNSYFADFKLVGQDSQAIAGWNGPGPYLIENNYLEAAGENVLFGGADASIPGLVPSDIVVRGNHVARPTSWRGERWQVKNLFELKNARRVLIEQNLFEHNWQAAQAGYAILFKSVNQNGRAPWSAVQHVTFRGNIVRRVAAAFNILGYDDSHPSEQTAHIAIHHNLVIDVDAERWGGNGAFLLIGGAPRHVSVEHNTIIQSGSVVAAYGEPISGFVFRDNLTPHNRYGIKGDSRATGNATIATYFPAAVVTHNVFADGPETVYPAGNWFPSLATWVAQFRDYHNGDYALAASSRYRGEANDGSDVGADIALLDAAAAASSGRR